MYNIDALANLHDFTTTCILKRYRTLCTFVDCFTSMQKLTSKQSFASRRILYVQGDSVPLLNYDLVCFVIDECVTVCVLGC